MKERQVQVFAVVELGKTTVDVAEDSSKNIV